MSDVSLEMDTKNSTVYMYDNRILSKQIALD
jgi:hypothetical protein